jgi:hypothetical protein
MKIPYGISDFGQIRSEGYFYADKTPFLPVLEQGYRHLVFLRPRRFGKSTLLSMMAHYYDLGRADRFDALFHGLWIHDHPTAERNKYLILHLDFSTVATDRGQEAVLRSFFEAVRSGVESFIVAYRERIPELVRVDERLGSFVEPEALLSALLGIVEATGHGLYVLIDEHDHFALALLSLGGEAMSERTGFVRAFYGALKSGTSTGAVRRVFVTGVSPLLLDDLSTGFNCARHGSLDPDLATLAGLTRADTERAVDRLLDMQPHLGDREALLGRLEEGYGGYRFSTKATEHVFCPGMVLSFLQALRDGHEAPRDGLDRDLRAEYARIQQMGELTRTDRDVQRALLSTIAYEGHIRSELVEHFGFKTLVEPHAAFLSLLYSFGMLTLGASPRNVMGYDLDVPNRMVRELYPPGGGAGKRTKKPARRPADGASAPSSGR